MTNPGWTRGCVQVYTGDGKGKTTAALGLALRAAGAGLPVLIVQFIKHGLFSEMTALQRFDDLVTVRQFGRGCFIMSTPTDEDRRLAREAMDAVAESFEQCDRRVVVMDEINAAVETGLVDIDTLLELIERKPDPVELVLTGRNAHPRLLERADLVTEMVDVRHYYNEGLQARIGIEK